MKNLLFVLFLLFATACSNNSAQNNSYTEATEKFAIALHGGAGTILKKNMTPELEKAYQEKMEEALSSGYSVLKNGGSSMDAVIATIKILEDSPLFNAGKGAVFTADKTNELDASIMNGETLEAGAVAGVTTIKNPITAAYAVMKNSPHVMLTRKGAEEFARQQGLELADPEYFKTERRWEQINNALQKEMEEKGSSTNYEHDFKYGTVGCVALDKNGNLAAGTSTGGMTKKRFGRVGDSPIIGAGTYASNASCAVSSTGHGEYFMRLLVAHDIAKEMEYAGKTIQEAGDAVIHKKLTKLGGTGGVIILDKDGNVYQPFNTPGMYRAFIDASGKKEILIYK